jgi:hypothetical protein
MNVQSLPPRPVVVTVVAAMLSVLISTGLLLGVARLFLDDGAPLQSAVAAERSSEGIGMCAMSPEFRRLL